MNLDQDRIALGDGARGTSLEGDVGTVVAGRHLERQLRVQPLVGEASPGGSNGERARPILAGRGELDSEAPLGPGVRSAERDRGAIPPLADAHLGGEVGLHAQGRVELREQADPSGPTRHARRVEGGSRVVRCAPGTGIGLERVAGCEELTSGSAHGSRCRRALSAAGVAGRGEQVPGRASPCSEQHDDQGEDLGASTAGLELGGIDRPGRIGLLQDELAARGASRIADRPTRAARQRRLAAVLEAQLHVAEAQDGAGLDPLLDDALVVHACAVGAAQVLHHEPEVVEGQLGVLARDRGIGDLERVARAPPDGERGPREGDHLAGSVAGEEAQGGSIRHGGGPEARRTPLWRLQEAGGLTPGAPRVTASAPRPLRS